MDPSTANAPATPTAPAEMIAGMTTLSLILIALFALAAVAVIWWGAKLRAKRRESLRELVEHNEVTHADAPAILEPIPPVAPAPPPTAPAEPVAAPAASDLTTLKGLGPKVAARFEELGITSVAELAALPPAEAEALDARMGPFQGRMARDRWVEQAALLSRGDTAGYEALFGKL
jgi:predicted flap endonuclease-1-like 5' DNA nuclease